MTQAVAKPQMGWIVIPKGITGNELALTLQAVPSTGFDWDNFDWDSYANSLKSLTLYFRPTDAVTPVKVGSATVRPLVGPHGAGVWKKIFEVGRTLTMQANLPPPASYPSAETYVHALALDGFAAAALDAFNSPIQSRTERSESMLLRRSLSMKVAAVRAPQSIDDVYHGVASLFHRSDVSLAAIPAKQASVPVAGDPRMPHWQRKTLDANPRGVDKTRVPGRIALNARNEMQGRLEQMNARTVADFLAENAPPAASTGRNFSAAATADSGRERVEAVLASLSHAFPLQVRLGLISDWKFIVDKTALDGEICVKLEFTRDDIDNTPLWTTIQDGRPRAVPASPSDASPPVSFLQSGSIEPLNSLLTTCDLRGNMMRTIAAIQAVFDRNQTSVKGVTASDSATIDLPSLRTGPLVMFVGGLAAWRSKVLSAANQSSTSPAFTMADLTIGVRPDIQMGEGSEWKTLMRRKLVYGIIGDSSLPEPDLECRTEGYVPLAQFSGEKEGQTHDELFSWSGWNPAVPFPGAAGDPGDALFKEHITAVPGSNPRFRYGQKVAVRLRSVLRDGSSFDPGTTKALGKPAATFSLLAAIDQLLRYEPIAAPELMLSSPSFPNGWTPLPQSANHVVLSSDPTRTIDCVGSDTRWILPGRLPNVVEIDKHGCFDSGLKPRVSAFEHADIRRGTVNGHEQAVFAPKGGTGDPTGPYHPDPLATHLVLALVRMHSSGDWLPVTDSKQLPCRVTHALYGPGDKWPGARALHVAFVASRAGTPLEYVDDDHEHRATVHVPPGESFYLVAYAVGKPDVLKASHAFGIFADKQDNVLVPMLANPLRVRISHFVTTPQSPLLRKVTPEQHRQVNATEVVVAIDGDASPPGTGSLDVLVRWEDPFDLPGALAPRIPSGPLQDSRYAQVSLVTNLDKAFHAAVDDAIARRRNEWSRPALPIAVNTEVRHAFPDGRHRIVEYFMVARSSALMPKPEGAIAARRAAPPSTPDSPMWRSVSDPVPVCILASRAPAAPVVRDVLPAFSFARAQSFNVTASHREAALSLIIERGLMTSGPGELVALVLPGAAASISNGIVTGIGADPVLLPAAGFPSADMTSYFADTDQSCKPSSAKACGYFNQAPPAGLLLYEPLYDAGRQAWRVDLKFNPDRQLPLPFLRLVVALFQPNGDTAAVVDAGGSKDVRLSPAVAVDFIQLPAQRIAVVTAHTDYPEHVSVTVSGPALQSSGTVRLEIKAVLEHDISSGSASPLFVVASDYTRLVPTENSDGTTTWSNDVKSTVGPLHGRVRVRIVERAMEGTEHVIEGPLYYFDTVEVAQLGSDTTSA